LRTQLTNAPFELRDVLSGATKILQALKFEEKLSVYRIGLCIFLMEEIGWDECKYFFLTNKGWIVGFLECWRKGL